MDDAPNAPHKPVPTAAEVSAEIERLQQRWRRYGYGPVVAMCLRKAQTENILADRMSYLQTLPWVNQRLAEWALADPDCPKTGRDALTQPDALALLQATHDFVHNTAPRLALQKLGLGGLRSIAFQQFAFQHTSPYAWLRQFFLFHGLDDNNKLLTASTLGSGLSVLDIIAGSYLLASLHQTQPGQPITLDVAVRQYPWFPRATFLKLLNAVSVSLDGLRAAFLARPERLISAQAAMLRPAFETHPLLELRKAEHYAWNQFCLQTALGGLLVRTLRGESNQVDLISQFGKLFEKKYVGRAVACLGGKVVPEADLKKLLNGQEVVDFLLQFPDGIVLVESKVREADEAVQGGKGPSMIGDRLKGSTIKAIEQAQSVANHARHNRLLALGVGDQEEIFLIIVVPDQHYMGTGEGIESYTGAERVQAILKRYDGTPPIPLTNIILLSADGLDSLVARVEQGKVSVLEFLRKFCADQEDPQSRVMVPEQLLTADPDLPLPSYLQEAEEAWMQLAVKAYGPAK